MNTYRMKNAQKNIYWGMINRILSSGIPFLMRTLLIYRIGIEYVGISSLFSSLLSFLSLAELGIGNAMIYAMYRPVAENDDAKICALLNLYKRLYRVIGTVISVAGIMLMPFLKYFIKGTYPANINIYAVYLIFLLNTVISYYMFAYKQSLLMAYQRNDIISKTSSAVQILMCFFQIIVLAVFRNYYYYIIMIPVFTILINIINHMIVNAIYPYYKCYGTVSNGEKKIIEKNVSALIGTKLSSIVLHSSDTLVISAFIGITSVAVYENYYYIINVVLGFLNIVYLSITAGIGNSIITESIEKNYNHYKTFTALNFWIISWCSTCIMCLSQTFMEIWVGNELMLSTEIVLLLVIYFFIYAGNKINLTYKDAAGLWWQDRFRPYVIMAVNLSLNILLVRIIGLYGVVLSTIASMLISWPWTAYVLYKSLFKRKTAEFFLLTMKGIVKIIAVCGTTYFLCIMIETESLLMTLIIRFIICTVFANLFYILLSITDKNFRKGCIHLLTLFNIKKC